jgi:two-component system, chemotaxis family, sensor kinase Cph1
MANPALKLPDEALLGQPINLTNCDREPIHIPGLIQPYGFLLCLDEHSRLIVQASANTKALLNQTPEQLIGGGLGQLMEPEELLEVERLWPSVTEQARLLGVRLSRVLNQPYYKFILHRYDGLLWVEGEPLANATVSAFDLPSLNLSLGRLLSASTTLQMCQAAVEDVRALTGFDRVAVYRFAEDGHGWVLAEAAHDELEPWLDLHYPATDIPQQARAMYLKNWLRFIPDVSYEPVPLVPAARPGAHRPPDMTYSVLRSVSPIHIQYLHNIGSRATMTISLIDEGKLWGLITCHHRTPRLVSYELRELCQFLAKTMSALLRTKQQFDELAYRQHISKTQQRLFELVNTQQHFVDGLHRYSPTLLDVFEAGGVAICFEGDNALVGHTPTNEQVADIVTWLQQHMSSDEFHTNCFAALSPLGRLMRSSASGLLAIRLSEEPGEYVIWFRPEVVQSVTWAGRDDKVEALANGEIFLSPRQSFEAWKQTVENTSAPWQPMEVQAARDIRLFISDIRLKIFNELQTRALALSSLNTELIRSNDELDSFAYVASHDLKEPLRGIHNYSMFLLEDYADKLDEDGVQKLQTLVRLSQRMENLIESLLQISRVGRLDLEVQPADLNAVLAQVLELLAPRIEQTGTTVHIAAPLPTVPGDAVRLGEVFNNLLTNAMRYNDRPEKYVEVGALAPGKAPARSDIDPAAFHILFVRDNGIGIAPRHHENIFRIFKRLHSQDKYGGGTGAGLAIVKKMVEKHGGTLWVESELGHGATFYFTIPKAI